MYKELYSRHRKAMLHTNKTVFMLMVYEVVMWVSRKKPVGWMWHESMTKGIAYCNETFDASSLQYLEVLTSITHRFFHSSISFPTAFTFTSESTREISSASARKSGYLGDGNGWATDKSMSVITLRSMGLVGCIMTEIFWICIKYEWIDEL